MSNTSVINEQHSAIVYVRTSFIVNSGMLGSVTVQKIFLNT